MSSSARNHLLVTLLSVLGAGLPQAWADPATVTFRDGVSPPGYAGTRDVTVDDGASSLWDPSLNYNGRTTGEVQGSSGQHAVLMRWDLSAIPTTAVVTSAELVLDITGGSTGSYWAYECLRPWVDSQATWTQYATGAAWAAPGAEGAADRGSVALNQSALTGSVLGAHTFALNAQGVATVQSWINTPATNHGFVVAHGTSSDGFHWAFAENSTPATRPLLRILANAPTPVTYVLQNGLTGYAGQTDTELANDTDPRTQNQNANALLLDGSPDHKSVLLRFDLSSLPPWSTVHGASLSLYVDDETADAYPVFESLQPWVEAEATWNELRAGVPWAAPGANGAADHGTAVLGTLAPRVSGAYTLTLTDPGVAVVQGWVQGTRPNNGFAILNYANSDGADLRDREDAALSTRPGLTVTYTEGQLALQASALISAGVAAPVTAQRQRLDGTPIAAGAPALPVTFSSDSSTGTFSSTPGGPGSSALTVSVPAGASTTPTVYYLEPASGARQLLATPSASPWNSGALGVIAVVVDGFDGGTGAVDGGTGAVDGGTDAGSPGGDAGTPDGGLGREPFVLTVGCGCGSASSPPVLGLALLALWAAARRRPGGRNPGAPLFCVEPPSPCSPSPTSARRSAPRSCSRTSTSASPPGAATA